MERLMFVCSRCGFAAFVERPMELERAGWRQEQTDAGATVLTCAACVTDGADDLVNPTATSLPRVQTRTTH